MMLRIVALLLLFSTEASADLNACNGQYTTPSEVNRRGFLAERYSSVLAIYDSRGWYFPINSTGCHDLSGYRSRLGSPINFQVNNVSDEQIATYLSATIVKFDLQPGQIVGDRASQIVATFRRNDSSNPNWRQMPAENWLTRRALGQPSIENEIRGIKFQQGGLFEVGGFESAAVPIGSYPSGLAELELDQQPIANWHGLIVTPLGSAQPEHYLILQDTIDNQTAALPEFPEGIPDGYSVVVRNDLIKFSLTAEPLLKHPILWTQRRNCIYFSYRIGGDTSLPPTVEISEQLPELFVIRLNSLANC